MKYNIRFREGKARPNWTIRKINGQPLPVLPSPNGGLIHELYVADRDSYEDTNGNLQRTILGEKDKFVLSFPAMTQQTMNELLARVPTGRLSVEYEDFFNPSIIRTDYFYRGDVKKTPYLRTGDGKYIYDAGTSFNLIAYNTRKLGR